ncbi:MAG: aryldialkylphosphatase [Acidobacteria bacterium]|nr:aryldialkylphosphatase [Acidobacteriota bacterium]
MKTFLALVLLFAIIAVGLIHPVSAQRSPKIPNLAGKALTVLGPVDPGKLGTTLMHEHIFIDFKKPPAMIPAPTNIFVIQPPPSDPKKRRGLTSFDQSLGAIMDFKNIGGGTIVDVSSFGLTRDPEALELISRISGLNVVMGAGFYMKSLHPPDMDKLTVEQMTDIIVRDVVIGAQGTTIRSGIIGEVGVVGKPLTENELKSIRVSARAARITGAPLNIHNFEPLDEMIKVLDIIESEGVDLHRVVMSHTGGRDVKTMETIFKRGAYVEWDFMGQAPLPKKSDEQRIESIYAMIQAGYANQMILSHDICIAPQLKENGGGGYTYIHDIIIPGLKAKGVGDDVIKTIMEDNPRRVLTFVAPQKQVKQKPEPRK